MVDTNAQLAERISRERELRSWSLAEIARRSGVSKSMLSKIERQEASPTAAILVRVASALELTLAELLTPADQDAGRLARVADQPTWTDPETHYSRRQVFLGRSLPLELVEVTLPPCTTVPAPASSYAFIRQVLWVLEGRLVIDEGGAKVLLDEGDRLEFGPPADRRYINDTNQPCRYAIAVVRR